MPMHYSKLATSPRLQRLLALLKERGSKGATSIELHEATGALNVATEASSLRHNGFEIECKRDGTSAEGAKIYRYRLIEGGQRELFPCGS